ncbi:MAG TPA: EAL domain-containing protein [Terracidiphilus sp.]|nr:EAL domain-containing protein [Terracidiphilus sp.]
MSELLRLERRDVVDQEAIGTVSTELNGHILRCDPRFAELAGYSQGDLPGRIFLDLIVPEHRSACEEAYGRLTSGQASAVSLEKRLVRQDDMVLWVRLTATLQRDLDGRPLHVLTLVEDIDVRKTFEMKNSLSSGILRTKEERYRNAFQNCPDAVLITQMSDGIIVEANDAVMDVLGYRREDAIGRTSMELDIWADENNRQRLADALSETGSCRDLHIRLKKKDGAEFWGQVSASTTQIEDIPCVLAFIRDISAAKIAEEEIRNLAFYDPLTGLPNRRLLWERLRQALVASTRSGTKQALLFLDLDRFKSFNDTMGHHVGDLMLQETARRIASCLREVDTVARLGGDEFVVMLENLSEIPEVAAAQAKAVGAKILAALGRPYVLEGRECRSTSSMGITVFGNHNESTNEVLQQADIAMYQAKAAGRNTMRFFAPAFQSIVNARSALEEDLKEALKQNQFSLYYQPQVVRGLFHGAEALIRWQHPSRGMVAADDFVPLAEESGLILPLGDWVLQTACTQIAEWAGRPEGAHLRIAVNVSTREFRQSNFVANVVKTLERTGANPQNLVLELTESTLGDNVEEVVAKMNELRTLGVSFSLDDFGTGYTSLLSLKNLPLSQLKIDRTFVSEILSDPASSAIAQTIICLSQAMGFSVIAEGVETEEQRSFLSNLGCHAFQGFLFSRPLPLGQF